MVVVLVDSYFVVVSDDTVCLNVIDDYRDILNKSLFWSGQIYLPIEILLDAVAPTGQLPKEPIDFSLNSTRKQSSHQSVRNNKPHSPHL